MLLSTRCSDQNIGFFFMDLFTPACLCSVWKKPKKIWCAFLLLVQKNKSADVLVGQVQADSWDVHDVSRDCSHRRPVKKLQEITDCIYAVTKAEVSDLP